MCGLVDFDNTISVGEYDKDITDMFCEQASWMYRDLKHNTRKTFRQPVRDADGSVVRVIIDYAGVSPEWYSEVWGLYRRDYRPLRKAVKRILAKPERIRSTAEKRYLERNDWHDGRMRPKCYSLVRRDQSLKSLNRIATATDFGYSNAFTGFQKKPYFHDVIYRQLIFDMLSFDDEFVSDPRFLGYFGLPYLDSSFNFGSNTETFKKVVNFDELDGDLPF